MRIASNMMSDRLLSNLQTNYARMAASQEQITTGRRVNRPSDDPTAAGTERLRLSDLEGVKRSQDSVSSAQGWLSASESGLSSLNDIVARARELALQGPNASTDQNGRNAMASEIDQLVTSAK